MVGVGWWVGLWLAAANPHASMPANISHLSANVLHPFMNILHLFASVPLHAVVVYIPLAPMCYRGGMEGSGGWSVAGIAVTRIRVIGCVSDDAFPDALFPEVHVGVRSRVRCLNTGTDAGRRRTTPDDA